MQASFAHTEHTPQSPASLHIVSGFWAGETSHVDYWKEQVETLKRDAIPFQVLSPSPVPSIQLDVSGYPLLPHLLDATSPTLEMWPTWCTFMTADLDISDTFLLLSVYNRQRCQFALHFQHRQHIPFLEAIEQTQQLKLSLSAHEPSCIVHFYDPELVVHLEKIYSVFRQVM
ncbi:MAG: hypothetical protein H0U76_19405 [Ktedonobacteraceae bacterium]|nr:hypothetical protein [Ktedonobacteraceae bacterium]